MGRNERPLLHWYPKGVRAKQQTTSGRYLSESERLYVQVTLGMMDEHVRIREHARATTRPSQRLSD
ncbi:hypothetical protein BIFGAL_03773 [Bifidobacterium gallicum DSM 20093 = LMG 11596]|uniref:Uncharacterized protein n=1 Tax=Bifidobacterium gallicum DSM 20093 = LMG 11596 TaxID=561180 RepID=D1NV89_9BIFI|nr:hypothetical protein BIFGAL_03773 [Bifidobacterium gallicum DSM 20093 = LMG 11596]KFI59685.1 hypothetical protein BGLCM_0355 [Bifidobacterium gallicum DSM 20093 = LMG 11596]